MQAIFNDIARQIGRLDNRIDELDKEIVGLKKEIKKVRNQAESDWKNWSGRER